MADQDLKRNSRGDKAMEMIRDYPIYASTSGITYEEAIGIAEVLWGEKWEDEYEGEIE